MRGNARKRGAEALIKAAAVFDIPSEPVTGEPRVTVTGRSLVHVENHRGLLEYGDGLLLVNARGLLIRITGEGLTVSAMSDMELVARGKLASVELIEK